MTPSIGRIVHYHLSDRADAPRAAIIVDVGSETTVNLQVFTNGGTPGTVWVPHVEFSETPKSGCWTWPPRV